MSQQFHSQARILVTSYRNVHAQVTDAKKFSQDWLEIVPKWEQLSCPSKDRDTYSK